MVTLQSKISPTFGIWYGLRQQLPFTERYDNFHVRRLEEIPEGERFDFTEVWLSEHRFINDGYLPSPPVVAGVPPKVRETVQA